MMTINDKIAAIETELNAATAEYDAARANYDAYDLDPAHFKDADRSDRLEELREIIYEKAAKSREIGARLDALKKERHASSRHGQMIANLMAQIKK